MIAAFVLTKFARFAMIDGKVSLITALQKTTALQKILGLLSLLCLMSFVKDS
jgi:hypothetical protein